MWPYAFEGRELSPANDKLATKCRNGCGHLLAIGRKHRFVLSGFGSNDICLHAKSLALNSPMGGLCELPHLHAQCWMTTIQSTQVRGPPTFPSAHKRTFRIARVMSALGQKRTCAVQKGMSALPPKATLNAFSRMSALGQKLKASCRANHVRFSLKYRHGRR